jgi:hypothetical protein
MKAAAIGKGTVGQLRGADVVVFISLVTALLTP